VADLFPFPDSSRIEQALADLCFNSNPDLLVSIVDPEGRVILVNDALSRLLGRQRDDLIGKPWIGECVPEPVRRPAAGGAGRPLGVSWRSLPLPGETGEVRAVLNLGIDKSDLGRVSAQLEQAQADFTNLVMNNRTGILVVNKEGRIRFANLSAQISLGRQESQIKGLLFGYPSIGSYTEMDIVRPDGHFGVAEVTATETEWEGEKAFLVMLHDITDRKEAEEMIRYQAQHDALSGLPNRSLFLEHLAQGLNRAARNGLRLAVLFLDLDRFKSVNDTLGHRIGDELLKAVALRLKQSLRVNDLVARLGGDEFCVLLEDIRSAEEAANVARKISAQFAESFELLGHRLYSRPSIGIALYPSDGADAETLLRNADTAMYEAKRTAEWDFAFYRPELTERVTQRFDLETRLCAALEKNEFRLRYQPQIDLRTRTLSGCEALLRWRQANGRLTLPGEFVPLLEETGLIVPVGDWLIRTVCAQLQAWREQGFEAPPVSVNLSAMQLDNDHLPGQVRCILDDERLAADRLVVEVTETTVMRSPDRSRLILTRLADLGIKLHLDDFGTGYSSMSLLGNLPFHALKIDRSFVSALPYSNKQAELVGAMVLIAHRLRMEVIAEGVETVEQLDKLRELGCDQAQGFLIGKPLTPRHFALYPRGEYTVGAGRNAWTQRGA
jgi:diguanylate cyclase (GGDEF)-like protein